MLQLQTTLEPFGPACAIFLTDEQVAGLASVKNPPVVVTIDGRSQRLRVARMDGRNCIGFSKAARAALGVDIGQEVTATIALDTTERTVEVPPELAQALAAEPDAKAAFEALSYSQRKEHARAVAEAKKPETRDRRIAKILESVRP
ncbi:YdeI/OmpD-associated family protein [Ornithinimicrobium cavernae]|uniref:YdeI/OmpD-associated family protein n=1 Tax=Ornithinimicrobium cavernae TaxID=2666047 RepID=UPI000D68BCF7|nr:YdeI/OmpD-associated family protein [Ornithinimicrobium cavernae]